MEWNLQKAQQLRASGMSFDEIGAVFGVTGDTVHWRIDPEYAAHRRQMVNARRRKIGYWSSGTGYRAERREAKEMLMEPPPLPDDTRTITGILMGDPLPTRSALDRRQAAAGADQ